ncbi:MAG TPA: hypothetical protein VE988_25335 [Gemmataceae bacterium]|nr:hypothetical protein [Gemmataceae bacterium]
MAKAKHNGNGELEQAMKNLALAQTSLVQATATMTQNQTAFAQLHATLMADLAAAKRESAERFAHVETTLLEVSRILSEHSRILAEHGRILEALPDAVRERMGFRVPERPS